MLAWLTIGLALVSGTIFSPRQATLGWHLSEAAYCRSGVDTWDCPPCRDSKISPRDLKTITNFGNSLYTAFDPSHKRIIVVFRGTQGSRNMNQDSQMALLDYPYCRGCKIHEGFSKIYGYLKDDVLAAVKSLVTTHPGSSIRLYGHSLGGALATLAAADLAMARFSPEFVYTYGQPRTGNKAFADWYGSKVKTHFRVTHAHDIVPHLPTKVQGYWHVQNEVFYEKEGSKTGYQVCDGSGEDSKCANQFHVLQCNIKDHVTYMDEIKDHMCGEGPQKADVAKMLGESNVPRKLSASILR